MATFHSWEEVQREIFDEEGLDEIRKGGETWQGKPKSSPRASAAPSDVADIDARMPWHDQEADESPSAEDVELTQSSLPVDRPSSPGAVPAE